MKLYGVANIDIVGSRKIRNREQLQEHINQYIDTVNKKYSGILAAPVTLTLGDEWQIILSKPSEIYNLIHEFQQMLWQDNAEIYAGIGIGGLSTPLSDDVRKMDGECFHQARKSFEIAKSSGTLRSKYRLSKANKVFLLASSLPDNNFGFDMLELYYGLGNNYLETAAQEIAVSKESGGANSINSLLAGGIILERIINLIIENNEILKSKMTAKQRIIYSLYYKLGSYRRVLQAIEGKDTISGISDKLNSASYFTIQRNNRMVSLLIDQYSAGK